MKSTKRHFRLEDNEYLVTPDSVNSMEYQISFKGKDVTNRVLGLIIYRGEFNE